MGRPAAVALLTLLIAQLVWGSIVSAQALIIPSISVLERYDSNVFWTPKSLLGPDQKPEDFITTVIPQMNIAHAGSLMSSRFFAGGLITKYLENPNLDFTGINAGGQLNLLAAANRVSQRIRFLTVRGTYQFSPASTGFGATGGGLGTGFGSTTAGAFNTGLITNRVSTNRYLIGVAGGYQLTGTTTLTGSYDYTKISFGEQSGGVNNPLFGTTGHRGSTTIATLISARDTVGATAAMSHFSQEQSSGGSGRGSFTTIAETLNWSRLWTQQLRTTLVGGGIIRLPVGSAIPGQSTKSQFVPTATAVMTYNSVSEGLRDAGHSGPFDSLPSFSSGPFDSLPLLAGSLIQGGITAPGAYIATMRYTYSIFPAFAFGAGPMKTHVVGVNATGGITSKLTGQVGANYAHSTRSAPSSTFDTFGVTVGARYLIGPVLASLTYNWLYFSNETDQLPLSQSSEYQFSKKMVMLSFSYAFTSQSFFRMGELGSTRTQGSSEGISTPSGAGTGSSPSGDGSGIY